jgi:hypothetical protein
MSDFSGSLADGSTAESGAKPMGAMSKTFDAGAVVAFWHDSAARLMRSNELFMRGMSEVARLEAELGQHLLERGMAGLKAPTSGGKPEERARTQLGEATAAYESLLTNLRKIADESRKACHDATLALFDEARPAAAAAMADVPHVGEPATNA